MQERLYKIAIDININTNDQNGGKGKNYIDLKSLIGQIYELHTYTPIYDKNILDTIARETINNGLIDPIHNRINFSFNNIGLDNPDAAVRIITYISTAPALRRLMFINQLSLSFIKYPLVTHTRYAHSLGVAYLMYRFLRNIITNRRMEQIKRKAGLQPEHITIGVIAGLIHDIGHPAWGHAFEPLGFKALPQYIGNKRYDKALLIHALKNENSFIRNIIDNIDDEDFIKVFGTRDKGYLVNSLLSIFAGTSNPPESVIRSLIDSECDVDRLDYIYRDVVLAGKDGIDINNIQTFYTIYEEYIDVVDRDEGLEICFKDRKNIRNALEGLSRARKVLYEEVYEHELRVAAGEMLQHALLGLVKRHNLSRDMLIKLLFLTDKDLISLIDVFGPDYSKYLVRSVLVNNLFGELCFNIAINVCKNNSDEECIINIKRNIYDHIKHRLHYFDSKLDIELTLHLAIYDYLKRSFRNISEYLKSIGIDGYRNIDLQHFVNVGTDELPLVFIYLTSWVDPNEYMNMLCNQPNDAKKYNRPLTPPRIKVYIPKWVSGNAVREKIITALKRVFPAIDIKPCKQ